MPQIPLDCPYCLTKQAAFQGSSFEPMNAENTEFIMLMQCQVCRDGIVARFKAPSSQSFYQWVQGQVYGTPEQIKKVADLIKTYPEPHVSTTPDHTPQNVERFYLQGMDNLKRNFDAAGTMFRKSLDSALKHLDPNGKGTLEKRIDSLPDASGVTSAMKTWAHEIRHLGNDAAHEDDPFIETEAKSLQAFTELFLTYAFTLPGMLAERKRKAQGTTT